jgi:hypothetical protein
MRILRNLTLHAQGDAEVALAASYGLALTREPEGVTVGPGEDGLQKAALDLAVRLHRCRQQDEAVLVGGHTGVWLAAVMRLTAEGAPLPALHYFDTRRIQDAQGRFVFVPEGLVRISW